MIAAAGILALHERIDRAIDAVTDTQGALRELAHELAAELAATERRVRWWRR